MSYSQALEVVIGLIFIYYVLGAIVSTVTQWINEAFETRGKALEKHLKKIVGDSYVGDFVRLPQLQALRPIRYKNWGSFITSNTEPKMLEKVPVSTLVDSYFDFFELTRISLEKEITGDQWRELISTLPDSEGKRAVAKWVGLGVTNVEDLRKRTSAYFTGVMEQAAATFRSNSRSFVIVLSILLTVFLGTDSIQLAQTLWTNAGVRALAVAQAEMAVAQADEDARIEDLIDQLGLLNIVKIGWWQTDIPPIDENFNIGVWARFLALKIVGLGLTVMAVSQGSSFWYDLLKKLASPSTSSSSSSSGSGSSSSSSSSSG